MFPLFFCLFFFFCIKYQRACSGKVAPTHFPPLPVKAVVQQQIKKSSKRSSASSLGLDSQHLQQDRHYFEEQKLPMIPAVVKQSSGNKHGSQLKRDRPMPVRLPPIEYTIQSSSGSAWSAGHKPDMLGLGRTAELNSICKLPDIKNAPVKCSRPKSGNLPRLLSVLPPISGRTEELHKNRKLPPRANMQRAESPTTDKTKKKRKMKLTFK
ncbi:uncharacterized protein LOC130163744 [Seriola aureovittata]|uniref:uncharacterized protein LOC130163744 n=1 Tax=Seriola aureovittata TaxID=2871759 RepID=UPI0024BE3775|nr:uncharacterized protein LOC130163744 [Seriola aureovittata]